MLLLIRRWDADEEDDEDDDDEDDDDIDSTDELETELSLRPWLPRFALFRLDASMSWL